MKYEVKFWKETSMVRGRHIASVVVDVGTVYDDWETASSDPGLFVIGAEGKGIAKLRDYGSMYLKEHILSTNVLLLCNWRMKTGTLFVGLTGYGTIYETKPAHWNKTDFQCEVTRKW